MPVLFRIPSNITQKACLTVVQDGDKTEQLRQRKISFQSQAISNVIGGYATCSFTTINDVKNATLVVRYSVFRLPCNDFSNKFKHVVQKAFVFRPPLLKFPIFPRLLETKHVLSFLKLIPI